MKRYLVLLIMASIVITGCQNTYCPPDEADAAIAELKMIAEEWDDALYLARSTARMSLAGPISELQQIKRKVTSLDVPECLEEAQFSLGLAMEFAIDGMVAFMAKESDEAVSRDFDFYYDFLDDYLEEIRAVNTCLPKCKQPAPAEPAD